MQLQSPDPIKSGLGVLRSSPLPFEADAVDQRKPYFYYAALAGALLQPPLESPTSRLRWIQCRTTVGQSWVRKVQDAQRRH